MIGFMDQTDKCDALVFLAGDFNICRNILSCPSSKDTFLSRNTWVHPPWIFWFSKKSRI